MTDAVMKDSILDGALGMLIVDFDELRLREQRNKHESMIRGFPSDGRVEIIDTHHQRMSG